MKVVWRLCGISTVAIAAVSPLGPAAAAGVLPGSGLLETDGRKSQAVALADLAGSLRRAAGETTRLLLKSPAAPRPIEVALVHRVVEQRSVADTKMWNRNRPSLPRAIPWLTAPG